MLTKAKAVATIWTIDSNASDRIACEPVKAYASHLPASMPNPTTSEISAADLRLLYDNDVRFLEQF